MRMKMILLFSLFSVLRQCFCSTNNERSSDKACIVENDDGFSYDKCIPSLANEYYCTLNEQQQQWLKSLYDEALNDRPIQKRRRREIRMLSDNERQNYFDAVNALKSDKSVPPNKFDVLALVHTNSTLCSVHRGSNFYGWHRVYLLLLDTALRQKDKSVVLPYWNSVIDNNDVIGPQNTEIFTNAFLGGGYDDLESGPFGNWVDFRDCPLTRDINGRNSTLLSPYIVNMIENNASVLSIINVTVGGASDIDYTVEGQHNLGHDWVGGTMDILNISANDPIFFLHHAFIDYIWEKFREKQRRYGIDPEDNYYDVASVERGDDPFDLRPFHGQNRTMNCFFWLRNIDGYWNNFTDLYEYEDSPECPDCGNSKYLTCNKELARCIGVVSSEGLSSDGNVAGIVVGSVIGSVVVILIIIVVIYLLRNKYKKDEGESRIERSTPERYVYDNKSQQIESPEA